MPPNIPLQDFLNLLEQSIEDFEEFYQDLHHDDANAFPIKKTIEDWFKDYSIHFEKEHEL